MENFDNLSRKIFKGIVTGKIKFTEHMNLDMAMKNLNKAIELEEYKAAQIFKDYINKIKS